MFLRVTLFSQTVVTCHARNVQSPFALQATAFTYLESLCYTWDEETSITKRDRLLLEYGGVLKICRRSPQSCSHHRMPPVLCPYLYSKMVVAHPKTAWKGIALRQRVQCDLDTKNRLSRSARGVLISVWESISGPLSYNCLLNQYCWKLCSCCTSSIQHWK